MSEKTIYFENSIFMPSSKPYTSFDKNLLFYDIDKWKSVSDTRILMLHCEDGSDIIEQLDILKDDILSICGKELKELFAEAEIGDVNIIKTTKIRLTDSGFIEKKLDALHEIAFQMYKQSLGETSLISFDFNHTYLDYN